MPLNECTHIVPALPPAINGLGDYAVVLARALRGQGVASRFVVPTGVEADVDGFPVKRSGRREARALAAALDDAKAVNVVVHFSGYGYARWGLCFWLVNGLRRWRRQEGGRNLITIFHELYATGPVWRTSFWTSPPQRTIARGLASTSDAIVTTSPNTAACVRAWSLSRRVAVMPVFSNVGELDAPPPLPARAPAAVVFGQANRRERAYAGMESSADIMGAGLRALGIERILDIGPGINVPERIAGVPVETLGTLPADLLSARLAEARVGLVDYPLHVVTKSGIVAAYLAHGLLCVNLSEVGRLPEGLTEGREFVRPASLANTRVEVDVEAVAAAGHAWYRTHDRAATAGLIHELLS